MKTHRYIPIVILILGFLTVNPLETEAASRYLEAAMEALKPMGGVILEVGVLPSPPPSRRQIIDADKGEACLQCHHMSYPVAPQKPEKAGEKALSSIQITPPGGLRLLTSLKDPINQAAGGWSPDGKKIMFSRKMGDNWDLWVMNRDGSDPIRLTTHPAAELWPYWSPDGKWVIFSSTIRGHLDVASDAGGRLHVEPYWWPAKTPYPQRGPGSWNRLEPRWEKGRIRIRPHGQFRYMGGGGASIIRFN